MLSTFRRLTAVMTTVVALSPLLSSPSIAGASSAVPATVSTIVSAGDTYVNEIRNVFFCSTKTCLAQRTANLKLAQDGLAALDAETLAASKAALPTPYKAPVQLLLTDDKQLSHAFVAFGKDTTKIGVYVDLGTIEFSTAAVASDIAVLTALSQQKAITFKLWGVGVSAIVYVIETDLNSFASAKNTGPEELAIAEHLVVDATALIQHANGPSAAYNQQVTALSSAEGRVAGTEVLRIQHKKAPLSITQVQALNTLISKDIAALATLQNKLIKG